MEKILFICILVPFINYITPKFKFMLSSVVLLFFIFFVLFLVDFLIQKQWDIRCINFLHVFSYAFISSAIYLAFLWCKRSKKE